MIVEKRKSERYLGVSLSLSDSGTVRNSVMRVIHSDRLIVGLLAPRVKLALIWVAGNGELVGEYKI